MSNTIAAAITARGSRTDEEKDQAREDKLMNKQIRNRRKLNRLEGKEENVGDKRKGRIKGRIKDAKTAGGDAKTEWHESREREYDTKGNHCPHGVDAKGNCKPKPITKTKTDTKTDIKKYTGDNKIMDCQINQGGKWIGGKCVVGEK